MFTADTAKIRRFQQQVAQSVKKNQQLTPLLSYLAAASDMGSLIAELIALQKQLALQLSNTERYFHTSWQQIEQMETTMSKKSLAKLSAKTIAAANSTPSSDSDFQNRWYSNSQALYTSHRYHTTLNANRNLLGYIKNGVCAGLYGGFDTWKGRGGYDGSLVQGEVHASVGSVHVSGDVKGVLYQNGGFSPALEVKAEAEGTLAQCGLGLHVGNEWVHADGEASLGIGVVTGSAKAVINKDELTLKAEVGAAAVQGKVEGSFTLFGVKITATGTGELGSAGAGAEFSSKKGELEFGGKLSLLAGLGFKIRINY